MMVMEYRIMVTEPGKEPFLWWERSTDYGRSLIVYRRTKAEHSDWLVEFESRQIGVWRVVDED